MARIPDNEVEAYLRAAGLSESEIDEVTQLYQLGVPASSSRPQALSYLDAEIRARGRKPPAADPNQRDTSTRVAPDNGSDTATAASRIGDDLERQRRQRVGGLSFDSGPAMDPDELAQSMALGVFPDGTPATGASVWEAIKNDSFRMGELSMPGVEERRQRGYRPARGFTGETSDTRGARQGGLGLIGRLAGGGAAASLGYTGDPGPRSRAERRFMTPSQALALLGSMDQDYLTSLQQQLVDSGLYAQAAGSFDASPVPSWGLADEVTRRAFMALFAEASQTPELPLSRVLDRLTDEYQRQKGLTDDGSGQGLAPFQPVVPSATAVAKLVDDMSQALVGKFATGEQKKKLIGMVQQGVANEQLSRYQSDASAAQGGTGVAGGGSPTDLDAFMAAIAELESGGSYTAQNPSGAYGKYQIMPANWSSWAERAGLGRSAARTPENQELVARTIMTDYYKQFGGSWRDVAVAWFAGPGAVGKANADSRSDGNRTVKSYADQIVDRMAALRGAPVGTPGANAPIYEYDPQAEVEAALKAADPAAWQGHAFADRAPEFFQLLAGVGRGPLSA